MNEFKNEPEKLTLQEEQFSEALEALLSNKPLPKQPLTPELAMALRLQTAHQKPVLRKDWDRITEKVLLKEFASSQKAKFWQLFWKPIAAGVLLGGLLLAVLSPIFIPDSNPPQTLAEVQDFESLSEAESLLGALPADAITEEGILVAELREDLHAINLLRQNVDLTLDEEAETGSFPHAELRDNALEVIEEERKLVAMIDVPVDIDTFAGKVAEWPTVNEGVDFETHAKAVNGYINHTQIWEEATLEWAKKLEANLN
ncbi:hypothetical protein IPG41_04815 [Candidatus Peregrinibacteria bacterium]|nr:MAG: hypothetical protein IPG41_04815 [Candidatus Peregrinibacteria bacterium]